MRLKTLVQVCPASMYWSLDWNPGLLDVNTCALNCHSIHILIHLNANRLNSLHVIIIPCYSSVRTIAIAFSQQHRKMLCCSSDTQIPTYSVYNITVNIFPTDSICSDYAKYYIMTARGLLLPTFPSPFLQFWTLSNSVPQYPSALKITPTQGIKTSTTDKMIVSACKNI